MNCMCQNIDTVVQNNRYLRLRVRVSVITSASTFANDVNISGLLEAVSSLLLANAYVMLIRPRSHRANGAVAFLER